MTDRAPTTPDARVYVEVSGQTGSGKSAVMGEIEIALKALGLPVEHDADFQAEKNGTRADWQEALDLYKPTVFLTERNISRAMTTTPDTVVVPRETIERLTILATDCEYAAMPTKPDVVTLCGHTAAVARDDIRLALSALAARPAATPGGEREDSAFKIASDLHAAYEQLIYGLPKYLEAENLTDEENMIREAYITLDVTAHRLAALSRPAPVAGEAVGAAEAEVGRAVYERLATLSDRNPDCQTGEWVEMVYLDDLTTSVEELGAFDAPHRPLSPTPQPAAARGGEVTAEMIEAFRDWYALDRGRPIMKGKARKIVGRILAASALSAKGGS